MNTLIFLIYVIYFLSTGMTYTFPPDFLFGVSTAAYQIEGAWNESGKGENIWDRFIHTNPTLIADGSNADKAADGYHHMDDDIELLQYLGVQFYRFSIAWTRIYPTGFPNQLNSEGVQYYDDLIERLLNARIIPMVTIYHWDLPQALQDLGGWTNPAIIEYYLDYVDKLFQLYGDRVKYWITFNEPIYQCEGYATKKWAPGVEIPGIANYICNSIVLKSHAYAYRLYEQKYKQSQQGYVGITIGFPWYEPFSNSTGDQEATKRLYAMDPGMFADPIIKTGDYSTIVKETLRQKSREQSWPRSRLPTLSKQAILDIKNAYDFLAINHYSASLVRAIRNDDKLYPIPSYEDDKGVILEVDPNWNAFESRPTMKYYPTGFRKVLNYIKDEYNNPPMFITENGFADFGQLNDVERAEYIREYLVQLAKALQDGVNVKGYAAWSLMDNFEWRQGYIQRYGLFSVDINDPNRKRRVKFSATAYKNIVERRQL